MRLVGSLVLEFLLVMGFVANAIAQHPAGSHAQSFGICRPVSERVNDADGCWIVADQPIGKINAAETYWHLDQYPSERDAMAAKTSTGVVLNAHGAWWLLTIEHHGWRPATAGKRVAEIGPLTVAPGKDYSALYLEPVTAPGMDSAIHRHSGPEAWYTLTGETCLETPEGKLVEPAGNSSLIVPEGTFMRLTATGTEKRRSLTLILHRTSEPPTTVIETWTPKGLCHQ